MSLGRRKLNVNSHRHDCRGCILLSVIVCPGCLGHEMAGEINQSGFLFSLQIAFQGYKDKKAVIYGGVLLA
jgi:hypothetical protein